MAERYFALVLHAHLPYVRHPEHEFFLEERWFFEALTETYLPLLRLLGRFAAKRAQVRIGLSISPTLLAMLEDPLLQERYDDHLGRLITLAEREVERTHREPSLHRLAATYLRDFEQARADFGAFGGRVSRPLAEFHRRGLIELGSTAATHGILPLLLVQPAAVEAQLAVGFDYFAQVFGFLPSGLWLPECAYAPGLDGILRRHGVRHFVVESHGIYSAANGDTGGAVSPLCTPTGVVAFGRDQASTREVWSAQHGYPGDPAYREFYRDIGFDLDPAYLKECLGGDGRGMTGIKYHRITGATDAKEPYDPDVARLKAIEHAGAFCAQRAKQLRRLAPDGSAPPVVVAPFDAELFGHWWYEGPIWLEEFLRQAAADGSFELTTLGGYLDRHPVHATGQPGTSTWGNAGYFETWLNEKTDWILEHLVGCAQRMQRLVADHGGGDASPLTRRVLDQCLRELLLAQSSDWAFIISAGTSTSYAERRVRDHVSRFCWLAEALETNRIDEERLVAIEYLDNPFPLADYRAFSPAGRALPDPAVRSH